MPTLRDLVKDRKVYSIDAARTVLEAARFMMEHNIGALPVLRNGELAGIFSERDIMNRVVAAGRTPGHTTVSEVMTANPRAVHVDETIEECLFIMHEFGFRHLPIVDGQRAEGTDLAARRGHASGCRTGASGPARRVVRAGFGLRVSACLSFRVLFAEGRSPKAEARLTAVSAAVVRLSRAAA